MKIPGLLFFLSVITISCNRVEPEPEPLRVTLELKNPNSDYTISSDTVTLSVKITLSKDFPQITVKIANQNATETQPKIYSKLLQLNQFTSARLSVPVDIFSEGNFTASDTIRLVKFRLSAQSVASMITSRSNHASVVTENEIWTFGGVESFNGEALNSLEKFTVQPALSESFTSSLSFGRSGHGMLYDSVHHKLHVFGGGNRQYARDGNDQLIPTESVSLSGLNSTPLNTENFGFYQDFGYYFDGSKLFIQGGLRKNQSTNSFYRFSVTDTLKKDFQINNSLTISEHTLLQDPFYNNFLYYSVSQFEQNGTFTYTGYIQKNSGAVSFEPVALKDSRNEHSAVNLEHGFVLLSGGFQLNNNAEKILNTFELQDLKTGKSYRVSTLLAAERASHTMCKIGNNIYILGGYDQTKNVLNSIEIFTYQF